MSIRPGYLLKITTWENDADNYATKDLDGLTADEVRFYIMIAKCFYSGSNNGRQTLGNTDVWSSYRNSSRSVDHNVYIDQKIQEWREAGNSVPEDWVRPDNGDDYFYVELLCELIDTWGEGEMWRVFDSFEVYHVPHEIQEVTSEFK
jgi:hypothetical protein